MSTFHLANNLPFVLISQALQFGFKIWFQPSFCGILQMISFSYSKGKHMRIAIISDIHGNQLALEAVLQDLSHQPAVDHLVIAGDLCLNGPCPREVLDTVQKLACPVIQGNADIEEATQEQGKGLQSRTTIARTL